MGKTKHEKLASQFKNFIIHIEQRVKKLKDKLKTLQLHFIPNFSFCNENVREVMVLSHHVALQIFYPSLKKRGVSSEALAYALMNTEENLAKIEKYRKKALVCCSTDE